MGRSVPGRPERALPARSNEFGSHFAGGSMNALRYWQYALAATMAAGSIGFAFAVEPPHQTSAGSKGDFTAADEAKSTTPVPPVPIAHTAKQKMSAADARL